MNFIITKHDDERISTSIITDDENEKRVVEYLQPVISVINKIYVVRENSAVNDMLNYTVGYSFGLYVQKIINRSTFYSFINTAKTVVSQYTVARIVQPKLVDEIFTSSIKLKPTAIKLLLEVENNIRNCDDIQDISNHVSVINGMVHCFVDLGLFKKDDFKDIFEMVSFHAVERTTKLTGCECDIEYQLVFE